MSRIDLLATCALIAPVLAAWLLPEFEQPQSFHDYADQRVWLGVPHAADVLSNLPFLLLGMLGLDLVARRWANSDARPFDRRVIWPYALLLSGVALTTLGSAWYHASPDDATLMWDRLPMALAFAGLVSGTLSDRASQRSVTFTIALAVIGASSVWYWHATGNLMPYLVMQASFIAVTLLATFSIKSPYTLASCIYWAAGAYALALIFERLDHFVHEMTAGFISGHTLKHLVASAAILIVYRMLRDRTPMHSD